MRLPGEAKCDDPLMRAPQQEGAKPHTKLLTAVETGWRSPPLRMASAQSSASPFDVTAAKTRSGSSSRQWSGALRSRAVLDTLGRDGHENVAVAAEALVGNPERPVTLLDGSHDQVAVWGRRRRAQSR